MCFAITQCSFSLSQHWEHLVGEERLTPMLFPLLEIEELHKGTHTLFLTARWESFGSCKLGDAVETCPKQL